MKKQLLTNMLAAIAALFTLMFALPQKAMAENYVTIDGVKKSILSTDFFRGYGDDNAFVVYLYLSSDKKEYVNVSGNKDLHAIYESIWLYNKEEKHEGQWYWGVNYTKEDYGNELFDAYANPDKDHAVFTNGHMLIYGDPRTSRKICGITLYNGRITDTKHGDGQEHTITIDYKHERTAPSAGTLTMGTVTATSIDLSWTHGSDETTPRDKLFYFVQYRKVGDTGWRMPRVGNATSYTIEGLEPETEYEVNICVRDESGNYKLYGVQTVTTKKATATKYGITIAGVDVTSANAGDLSVIPGVSGTVKYNHSKKTLYLNGVKIETTAEVYGIDSKIDGLTIKAYGNNTIKVGGFSAIRNDESHCNITGGTLYLSGEDFGLYVMNKASMTIENSTIESDGSVGTNNDNAKMTIRNSKLTAKKKNYYASMMGIKELTLEGCAITQPTGAYYDSSLKGVALNGQLVTGKVVIEPKLPEGTILYEGFEQGALPEGWTVIDNDGDGYNWKPASSIFDSVEFVEAHSGNDMFSSQSYDNSTSKALTPDNYLITPEVSGATSVKFYANAQDKEYPADHLAVCVSKTGKAASDFTIVEEWTMTAAKKGLRVQGKCYEYNIDLPAGTKYVAFRHYNCTDQFIINIDDVTIFGNTTGIESATTDAPAKKQGVYNLQGVRLGTSLDRLPKGIYIVDGRKVVKK